MRKKKETIAVENYEVTNLSSVPTAVEKEIDIPVKKEKKPKVELVSYTVRATIPTGAYSNICPEVTVKAKTLEEAERAVMPHIEKLFAKYRDGNGTPPPEKVEVGTILKKEEVTPAVEVPKPVLAAPFNEAKKRIDMCTNTEALNVISKRIEISEKLIDSEKAILRDLVAKKEFELS